MSVVSQSAGVEVSRSSQKSHGKGKKETTKDIAADRELTIGKSNKGIPRFVGFSAVIAALVAGAVSFMILIGVTPVEPTPEIVIATAFVNGGVVSFLLFLIVREAFRLIRSRQRGRAAARLHIRIVGLFSLVAAIPAILVAIVASITLDIGLDRWFEIRTRTIVESSVGVARAYLNESYRGLQGATISMARDLDRSQQLYSLDRAGFRQLLTLQTRGRGMLGAFLLRSDGSVLMESDIKQERSLPQPPREALEAAADGEPALIPPGGRISLVGAVFKMARIPDAYLYTLQVVNPEVFKALQLMQANTAEYKTLESNRLTYQIAFAILYIGVCLIVLLSAIWMGISVADRLVSPIRRLITAADEVSSGNLDVEVSSQRTEGDLRSLSNTFNVMISELKSQRNEILAAKDGIDQRARFIEAVLSGVSSAVLGVNEKGDISIANPPAMQLFSVSSKGRIVGRNLKKLSSDIALVLKNAVSTRQKMHHEQINLTLEGVERALNIQVTSEQKADQGQSWVITIDDITDLVSAQRNSAWANVARRIAHEIKNPLTPIQLSAERIKRRFGKQIELDKDIFDQCTETIVRQVSDIGRMVDEFSSFGRMPKPQMKTQNLVESAREAIFMQKVAFPDIEFSTDFENKELEGCFDARLISQALTNVIKNAAESIEVTNKLVKGKICVRAFRENEFLVVEVIDNGKGLPKTNRNKLLEPYMTTRQKGTGLGLAIVRKVVEDHGGSIQLTDSPLGEKGNRGAMTQLKIKATIQEKQS